MTRRTDSVLIHPTTTDCIDKSSETLHSKKTMAASDDATTMDEYVNTISSIIITFVVGGLCIFWVTKVVKLLSTLLASIRLYRIDQTKAINVYKLVQEGYTKEELWKYAQQGNSLLELVIEYPGNTNNLLADLLAVYDKNNIPLDIQNLPSITRARLYANSWGVEVLNGLYDKSDTYFIPRGQNEAKMHALLCYNTFEKSSKKELQARTEAIQESKCIKQGFEDAGFTVLPPTVDWTCKELLDGLSKSVESISRTTSVLFISIMTHGDTGILFDKNGERVEINKVQKTVRGQLPRRIPLVFLFQSCQGPMDPKLVIQSRGEGPIDASLPGPEAQCPIVSPISVMDDHTTVITATRPGYWAICNHFLYHMANQLRSSDGVTPFYSLYTRCANAMAQAENPSCSAQIPVLYSIAIKNLVLPKSNVYDGLTKKEKRGSFPPQVVSET